MNTCETSTRWVRTSDPSWAYTALEEQLGGPKGTVSRSSIQTPASDLSRHSPRTISQSHGRLTSMR